MRSSTKAQKHLRSPNPQAASASFYDLRRLITAAAALEPKHRKDWSHRPNANEPNAIAHRLQANNERTQLALWNWWVGNVVLPVTF